MSNHPNVVNLPVPSRNVEEFVRRFALLPRKDWERIGETLMPRRASIRAVLRGLLGIGSGEAHASRARSRARATIAQLMGRQDVVEALGWTALQLPPLPADNQVLTLRYHAATTVVIALTVP